MRNLSSEHRDDTTMYLDTASHKDHPKIRRELAVRFPLRLILLLGHFGDEYPPSLRDKAQCRYGNAQSPRDTLSNSGEASTQNHFSKQN